MTAVNGQPSCRIRRAVMLVAGAAVMLLHAGAGDNQTLAQDATTRVLRGEAKSPPPDWLAPYLADLDSADYEKREAATRAVATHPKLSEEGIVDFVASNWSALSPEVIDRLLNVARDHFIASPGAIGFQFSKSPIATIESVIAEAPAAQVLRRGDRILSINGTELPDTSGLQQPALLEELSHYKAGALVRAQILRDDKPLDVEFRLADPYQLPSFEGFIATMQPYLQQRWEEEMESRLPDRRKISIDMTMLESEDQPAHVIESMLAPGAATRTDQATNYNLASIARERIGEISVRIAQVAESTARAASEEERDELESLYLELRSELAQLNARLRLLDAVATGRRR